MTEVEVESDEWATALKWYGRLYGKSKKKPSQKDIKAKIKFQVLLDQAKKDEALYSTDDDD